MATRKNITWKVPAAARRSPKPRPFIVEPPVKWADAEKLQALLVPGTLFVVQHAMQPNTDANLIPAEYPYLVDNWVAPESAPVRRGDVAVYVGTARMEEERSGTLMRVPRHTFFINGTRYVITNLNLISPVK